MQLALFLHDSELHRALTAISHDDPVNPGNYTQNNHNLHSSFSAVSHQSHRYCQQLTVYQTDLSQRRGIYLGGLWALHVMNFLCNPKKSYMITVTTETMTENFEYKCPGCYLVHDSMPLHSLAHIQQFAMKVTITTRI